MTTQNDEEASKTQPNTEAGTEISITPPKEEGYLSELEDGDEHTPVTSPETKQQLAEAQKHILKTLDKRMEQKVLQGRTT